MRRWQAGWLAFGLVVGLTISGAQAGGGLDSFGPAQGSGSSGGGSGDLTAVTVTGDGITVTDGTGPVPDLALIAVLEEIADHWTADASGNLTGPAAALGPAAGAYDLATRSETLGGNTALLLLDNDSGAYVRAKTYTSTAADGSGFVGHRARGTHDSPAAVQAGDLLAFLSGSGQTGTNVANESVFSAIYLGVQSGGTVSTVSLPGNIQFWTVEDGSTTILKRAQLNDDGTFDVGPYGQFAGSALGTSDIRRYRSAAKTWTIDDGAGGAATVAVVGSLTATGAVKAGTRYSGTVAVMSGSAVDFAAAPILTKAVTGNLTLTTTVNSLPASGTGCGQTIILTADGSGPYTLAFPSAWQWLGTKPSSLAASTSAVLSLTAYGNAESQVIACYTVLGTGS